MRLADLKCYISDCPNLIGRGGARGLCNMHYLRMWWTGSSMGSQLRRADERFFEHVEQVGDCWAWTASRDYSGYGLFKGDRLIRAHIWSYCHFIADVPEGFEIDHTCHSKSCELGVNCPHRRCVNPWHLEAVPPVVNTSRGRGAKRTHCPDNHEYTEENTYINPKGMQVCRKCMVRHRANYQRKRNQLRRRAA